ncbi:MAG: ATP-binding cassette domain-containing protein, partial [Armatimonadetes bacterium]|nr:ATP-binding cassette domain-containing protein [Armatimonadota bacterium]
MSPSDSVGPPLAAADPGVAIRLTPVVCRGRRGDALRGVTLSLHEGERVALFGAAGCGKTMLLRVLSGEVRPDAGEVQPSAFGTVYVAEEPPQPGRLSVRDKLMWRLSRRGLPQQAPALPPLQRAARVAEAMELLDLDTARDVPERELSRTQRIALDIAGAVASDAALLLLDNVTACLAEPVTARLFAYLDGRRAADG